MTITVGQIAQWVGGEVDGDAALPVRGARPLREAGPGDVSFVEGDRNLPLARASAASALLVRPDCPPLGKPVVRVPDPLMAFALVLRRFRPARPAPPPGIDPTARIDPSAAISPDARIDAYVVVGPGSVIGARCRLYPGVVVGSDCRLGEDVTLHPNVVLYDGCVLGDRVTVHANAVLGADGFGYRPGPGGHAKVPQLGSVEIGSDVEIGAGSAIDRGTFGPTRVGDGTKIDNLVQIGHNCQIGRHNLLAAQVGIAGSCTTGDGVIMGGQVGIADHLHLGSGVIVAAQSGVTRDLEAGQRFWGTPAVPDLQQKRMMISLQRLPELLREVRQLRRLVRREEGAAEGREGGASAA